MGPLERALLSFSSSDNSHSLESSIGEVLGHQWTSQPHKMQKDISTHIQKFDTNNNSVVANDSKSVCTETENTTISSVEDQQPHDSVMVRDISSPMMITPTKTVRSDNLRYNKKLSSILMNYDPNLDDNTKRISNKNNVKREVLFSSKDKIIEIIHVNDIPDDIHDLLWWTREEISQLKQEQEDTIYKFEAGKSCKHDSIRGLETRLGKNGKYIYTVICKAKKAVFDEQDLQIMSHETKSKIQYNFEEISSLYELETRPARDIALRNAQKDESVIQQYVKDVRLQLKMFREQQQEQQQEKQQQQEQQQQQQQRLDVESSIHSSRTVATFDSNNTRNTDVSVYKSPQPPQRTMSSVSDIAVDESDEVMDVKDFMDDESGALSTSITEPVTPMDHGKKDNPNASISVSLHTPSIRSRFMRRSVSPLKRSQNRRNSVEKTSSRTPSSSSLSKHQEEDESESVDRIDVDDQNIPGDATQTLHREDSVRYDRKQTKALTSTPKKNDSRKLQYQLGFLPENPIKEEDAVDDNMFASTRNMVRKKSPQRRRRASIDQNNAEESTGNAKDATPATPTSRSRRQHRSTDQMSDNSFRGSNSSRGTGSTRRSLSSTHLSAIARNGFNGADIHFDHRQSPKQSPLPMKQETTPSPVNPGAALSRRLSRRTSGGGSSLPTKLPVTTMTSPMATKRHISRRNSTEMMNDNSERMDSSNRGSRLSTRSSSPDKKTIPRRHSLEMKHSSDGFSPSIEFSIREGQETDKPSPASKSSAEHFRSHASSKRRSKARSASITEGNHTNPSDHVNNPSTNPNNIEYTLTPNDIKVGATNVNDSNGLLSPTQTLRGIFQTPSRADNRSTNNDDDWSLGGRSASGSIAEVPFQDYKDNDHLIDHNMASLHKNPPPPNHRSMSPSKLISKIMRHESPNRRQQQQQRVAPTRTSSNESASSQVSPTPSHQDIIEEEEAKKEHNGGNNNKTLGSGMKEFVRRLGSPKKNHHHPIQQQQRDEGDDIES